MVQIYRVASTLHADLTDVTTPHVVDDLDKTDVGIWEVIGSGVLSSTVGSITISSIPTGYRAIKILLTAICNGGAGHTYPYVTFNSDTAANYKYQYTNGTAITDNTAANYVYIGNILKDSVTPSFIVVYIDNGASITKSLNCIGGAFDQFNAVVGFWNSTAEISRIDIDAGADSFLSGTKYTILGLVS